MFILQSTTQPFFLAAPYQALFDNGCAHTDEGMFAPSPCEIGANILNRGLPRISSDCAVNTVAVIFPFACADEIACTAPDCLGWFLYDFLDVTNVLVPEWQTKSLKGIFAEMRFPGYRIPRLRLGMLTSFVTPA